MKISYRKYTWIGNKISDSDMAALYVLKQKSKRPITALVAEAVSLYLKSREVPK